MKIFRNTGGILVHVVDRLPERQCDVEELARMFPDCVLKRRSNGKAIFIQDVKVKNIHWYE